MTFEAAIEAARSQWAELTRNGAIRVETWIRCRGDGSYYVELHYQFAG